MLLWCAMVSTDRCFHPASQLCNGTHPSWAHSLCLYRRKNLFYSQIRPINTTWCRPAVGLEEEEEASSQCTAFTCTHTEGGTRTPLRDVFGWTKQMQPFILWYIHWPPAFPEYVPGPFFLQQFICVWHSKCTGENFASTLFWTRPPACNFSLYF